MEQGLSPVNIKAPDLAISEGQVFLSHRFNLISAFVQHLVARGAGISRINTHEEFVNVSLVTAN